MKVYNWIKTIMITLDVKKFRYLVGMSDEGSIRKESVYINEFSRKDIPAKFRKILVIFMWYFIHYDSNFCYLRFVKRKHWDFASLVINY